MDPNWFPLGREVPADELVGREAFIEEVTARVGIGESLVISSPRRTGKTSVVHEVLRRLRAAGWMTAFVDLMRTPSELRLAERLMDAVLENETGLQRTLARLRGAAATAATRLQMKARSPDGLELAMTLAASPAPDLEDALELGNTLAERTRRRICIVFDEFQQAPEIRKDAYAFMRSVFQHHRRAVYLFLGSHAGLLEQQFTKANAPFFKFTIVRPLPPVPPADWAPYLVRKYLEIGRPVDAAFARALEERTGGHPHCTMLTANMVLLTMAVHADVPPHLLLDLAYAAALEDLGSTYDEVYRSLGSPPLAQEMLLRLANGEPPYAGGATTSQTRALRALVDRAIVRHVAHGRYEFVEPMLADYLRRTRDR